jgi:hypothetical protein
MISSFKKIMTAKNIETPNVAVLPEAPHETRTPYVEQVNGDGTLDVRVYPTNKMNEGGNSEAYLFPDGIIIKMSRET